MPSKPLVLAFDTSAAHCAAALLCGDQIVATRSEALARGQAERLFPMLEELLSESGRSWTDVTRIGVGVGPGNFTGIRISVAAARGLALSLGVPAIGVSALEVQCDDAPVLATVAALRAQVYAQVFDPAPQSPALMPLAEAEALAKELSLPLKQNLSAEQLVRAIAARAATGPATSAPAPLYIRAADAAPPRDPAPVILP